MLINNFQKLAHQLQPIKRTTTKTRVTKQRFNKNKKLREYVQQQKQKENVSELSVLGTLLFW